MGIGMRTVAKAIGADEDLVSKEQTRIEARANLYKCISHEVKFDTDLGTFERRIRSLRLGKRIPEDWAALLWTENARVECGGDAEQEYIDAILGEKHAALIGEAIERGFGLGTTGLDLIWDYSLSWLGRVKPRPGAMPYLDVTDAYGVIPLAWDKNGVSEAAFVSYGKDDCYIREHRADGIYNRRFRVTANTLGAELPLPGEMAEFVPTEGPTFALLKPAIAASEYVGHPYGISVLDSAQDHIFAADLCFDNFTQDFELGGKKVFVSESLLRKDENGDPLPPDRSRKQMYLAMRDPVGEGEFKTGIKEHNPELRVGDNRDGINTALDLVSHAVGFGYGYYSFEGDGGLKTATEVVSQNSDLYRMRRKHFLGLAATLERIARAALRVGSQYGGQSLDADTEIRIVGDDSVIEDDKSRIDRGLSYFQAGVLSKKTFLVDYMHMTEEQAEDEMAQSAPTIPGLV